MCINSIGSTVYLRSWQALWSPIPSTMPPSSADRKKESFALKYLLTITASGIAETGMYQCFPPSQEVKRGGRLQLFHEIKIKVN